MTLVTEDGVPIEAVHLAGDRQLVFVIAHGFTLHWNQNAVWQTARRLNRARPSHPPIWEPHRDTADPRA